MQRLEVLSGTIMSVGYEAASSTLELELISGEIVQFFHVPLTTYIGLMKAPSKDEFYSHHIRSVYESNEVAHNTTEPGR